jgi:hypothetical protein
VNWTVKVTGKIVGATVVGTAVGVAVVGTAVGAGDGSAVVGAGVVGTGVGTGVGTVKYKIGDKTAASKSVMRYASATAQRRAYLDHY